jgi:hypothetical protein
MDPVRKHMKPARQDETAGPAGGGDA